MKKHRKTTRSQKVILTTVLSTAAACVASAFELQPFGTNMPPVDFHGFASQGFIANSGNNNYLGGKSSQGTFDDREYGINASIAYNKFRVGAQFFGQKLGQYGDDKIKLDWGNVDYQASQWFGLRAGRVKTPRGLYNETLDLDSTRTFALLPQSVYDARLRDFNSSFDGGMAYGNIEMKSAGSLDYRAYVGSMSLSTSSGASDYFNNDMPFPNTSIGMDYTYGGSLFWNTPIQGLKVGYSAGVFANFVANRDLSSLIPDFALTRGTSAFLRQLVSAEYTYGKWIFASEIGEDDADYDIPFPGTVLATQSFQSQYGYVSATRQMTDKLSLGTYYSYSREVVKGTAAYGDTQNDFAIAARYDFTQNLLAKLEVHYMDNSGKLFNTPSGPTANQPRGTRDNSWVMIVAKVTFSF